MRIKKYIYGMRLRGFSLGAQPMRGLIRVLDSENKEDLEPYLVGHEDTRRIVKI